MFKRAIFLLPLLLVACASGQRVQWVAPAPVPTPTLSQVQARDAILQALQNCDWEVVSQSKESVQAEIVDGTRRLRVHLSCRRQQVTIRYLDSTGLGSKKAKDGSIQIHSDYADYVATLRRYVANYVKLAEIDNSRR